jgi:AmmeMemoRadiSam system protein B
LFYPADPALLAQEVDVLLADAGARSSRVGRSPKAVIAPHAGYLYSGPIAGAAYATLRPWAAGLSRMARIVLLGPAHRVAAHGLVLPAADVLRTPLGDVAIDLEAAADLIALPQVSVSSAVHAREHSLEVHLPFLQRVVPRFTLVPLAVGDAEPEEVAEVLERLWDGEETRVIASSDLSHYLPYATARQLDERTAGAIERAEPVMPDQACGARVINGLAEVARRRGLTIERLDLRSSGDTAGSQEEVVGYGAFAYYEPAGGRAGAAS